VLHWYISTLAERHSHCRNSFSQLVGEEFLKYFDFTNESIDAALRQFVKHLTVTSESQDREQLLSHFAHRYYECNSDTYKSEGNL
jgi:PH and SEC7 domain-containing protein